MLKYKLDMSGKLSDKLCEKNHSLYVSRGKAFPLHVQNLKCEHCNLLVNIHVPKHVHLYQCERFAEVMADKINKGTINVKV